MIGLLAASAPEARGEYANGTRERNGNSQLSHGCQSTASHRQNGVVYTPSMLADFVAAKLTSLYLTDQLRRYAISTERLDISNLRILDPACGEGA